MKMASKLQPRCRQYSRARGRQQRMSSSSTAAMRLNGTFTMSLQCLFPSHPKNVSLAHSPTIIHAMFVTLRYTESIKGRAAETNGPDISGAGSSRSAQNIAISSLGGRTTAGGESTDSCGRSGWYGSFAHPLCMCGRWKSSRSCIGQWLRRRGLCHRRCSIFTHAATHRSYPPI